MTEGRQNETRPSDDVFEGVYQQTVDFIAGEFGSKETYRAFGRFLLARMAGHTARYVCPTCGEPAPYGDERLPWLAWHQGWLHRSLARLHKLTGRGRFGV